MDVTALESMPREELEAEITALAGHLAAAECRWLLLVAEYDRRAGWLEWGCRSCVVLAELEVRPRSAHCAARSCASRTR